MFHDTQNFAFTAPLRANWQDIYLEYLAVRHLTIDWFERELYGQGWKVYGLFDFPHGLAIPGNTERCPLTVSLIEHHVPRHGAVGFSVLQPGTCIEPHEGYQGNFLRCHLALRVPHGDCGLRVGSETRPWREGHLLVLDDRVEHEAWNRTAEDRVVLLFDFVPEGPGKPDTGAAT